jgi:hypothetical protein
MPRYDISYLLVLICAVSICFAAATAPRADQAHWQWLSATCAEQLQTSTEREFLLLQSENDFACCDQAVAALLGAMDTCQRRDISSCGNEFQCPLQYAKHHVFGHTDTEEQLQAVAHTVAQQLGVPADEAMSACRAAARVQHLGMTKLHRRLLQEDGSPPPPPPPDPSPPPPDSKQLLSMPVPGCLGCKGLYALFSCSAVKLVVVKIFVLFCYALNK